MEPLSRLGASPLASRCVALVPARLLMVRPASSERSPRPRADVSRLFSRLDGKSMSSVTMCDALDDLFPGSGGVAREWAKFTGQPSLLEAAS